MQDAVYQKLADRDNKMFVVVAGNIGSGKTTLTEKLSTRLNWRPEFESVEDNPFLSDFYSDMAKWSFHLQVYFLTHRFDVHKKIIESSASSIQDRSIYEDRHIFARALYDQGDLSHREYKTYQNLYYKMMESLPAPDIMIFLKRSVDKLMDRIAERGRDYESSIPRDYIARLNDYYQEWYESYDLGKRLIVDTDDLDFLKNEDDFSNLVTNLHDSIDQQDMLLSMS